MRRSLTLLGPFAIYLAGVVLLGDWIIDDAGISYAYARSAAAGHGLVSQPGRPPVEGFSNFSWVALMMPLFALRLFEPVIVAKALGALLVLGALALVQRALRHGSEDAAPGVVATGLAAAAPPIVIWSASGLENGLTLLLVAALLAHAVERPRRWHARSGAIAGLLGVTHPGGLVFALFGPALALGALARRRPPREVARELSAYASGLGAVLVPFFVFRLAVFGRALPHTYYAKRAHATFGDRLAALAADPGATLTRLVDLTRGALGAPGPVVVALTLGGAAYLAARGRLARPAAMSVAMLGVALAGYAFIDADWMGEHRFGTAAVLLAITSFAAVASCALGEIGHRRIPVRARIGGAAALIAAGCALSFPRTIAFAENPPTPLADVDRHLAKKLDAYARALGPGPRSVLLPDVGAMLLGSRLTVYDAAGLCEPDVIRTLKRDGPIWLYDHPAFYDLVFEEMRPTFISTHHFWTLVTAFDQDPRFARDYVAIDAYEDEYVKRVFGRTLRSGDFVRRDALPDPGALDRMRSAHRPPPRLDPLVVRLGEALRGEGARSDNEAVRELRAAAREALSRDDPNRAATLFARLLSIRPGDLDAALGRAAALDSAVRPDEARPEWVRVQALAPAGTPAHSAARARLAGLPLLPPSP